MSHGWKICRPRKSRRFQRKCRVLSGVCKWLVQARWRRCGSRPGGQGAGSSPPSPSTSASTGPWTSFSCTSRRISSAAPSRQHRCSPITTFCCSAKPSAFCGAHTESQESQQRFDTLTLDFFLAHHQNPLAKEVQPSSSWLPLALGIAAWSGKHAACAEVADQCIRPVVSFREPGQ